MNPDVVLVIAAGLVVIAVAVFVAVIIVVSRFRPASGGGADWLETLMNRVTVLENENKSLKAENAQLREAQAEDRRRIAAQDTELAKLRAQVDGLMTFISTRSRDGVAATHNQAETTPDERVRSFLADKFSRDELKLLANDIGMGADELPTPRENAAQAIIDFAKRQTPPKLNELLGRIERARPGALRAMRLDSP